MTLNKNQLARCLKVELEGDTLFDKFSRGLYSTDASHYQINPIGVVIPKSADDISQIITIAAQFKAPILPRGSGTSQCGQTVGKAIVIDTSKHLNKILEFNALERTIWVEPGLVLDKLNAFLKPHGLCFPVDVSTSSRATIGGMAGNNSCGARSIRYGPMRDNVRAIDAVLMNGESMRFGELSGNQAAAKMTDSQHTLISKLLDIGHREAEEINHCFPKLMRRVGGYNIDALMPNGPPNNKWTQETTANPAQHPNLAHLLIGSEGTLAFSNRIQLILQPIPQNKVLGVCHFPTFHQAMDSARHIVKLKPTAVELVDRTMIDLARDIPIFKSTVEKFVYGEPDALLLVEFSGDDFKKQLNSLSRLCDLMGDLGFANSVVEAINPDFQAAIWEVRKSGLNIMMSMKGDGKPISFIEDCAVKLEDLAEYTARLTDVFKKHGTSGTWYAHASVGCLHVRPIINLKSEVGAKKMRAIAEEAFAMVRDYKGSHSGEHGDGLVRSEFHESMFGNRITTAFEAVKDIFDPTGLFNPGKIVRPSKMDDRNLFRFKPEYKTISLNTAFDWSIWGGFSGAVEMCNNNGACRKRDAGVMCPSYRATGDEKHLTRGRANTLRLALSGQLGSDAFTSKELFETMKLCIGCKGCKRECPTGVDMAKMKTEFLFHFNKNHRLRIFDHLVAYLPRYAPIASKIGFLLNLRDKIPGLAVLSELLIGFSRKRTLPKWHSQPFNISEVNPKESNCNKKEVVLWIDTFNTWFEPENARAALNVLYKSGYRVHVPFSLNNERPLCCGRTFLSTGLVEEAKFEAQRMISALKPFVERNIPIIGLEPSCLLTMRDEFQAMLPGEESDALAKNTFLFEEFLAREIEADGIQIPLKSIDASKILIHGHCHQKAFDTLEDLEKTVRLLPDIEVKTIASGCCGMAGSFGYDASNYNISMKIAEESLLPAIRDIAVNNNKTLIIAGGTSCRHQINDGTNKKAIHVARLLESALDI